MFKFAKIALTMPLVAIVLIGPSVGAAGPTRPVFHPKEFRDCVSDSYSFYNNKVDLAMHNAILKGCAMWATY